MADSLTSVVVTGALNGLADTTIERNISEESDGKKKFDICNWKNLTCCETFDRINLIIAALFVVAVVGGAIAVGAGVTPISSVVIIYGIWATYVGISTIVYLVKYMELGSMAHQTNRLRKEVDELQEEMGKLESTNIELKGQVDKLQGQLVEFDDLINKFSTSFQIHNSALADRVEDITKASGTLEDVLEKIKPMFDAAVEAQKEGAKQLKSLEGSVALLGRGINDFGAIKKEQEKLVEEQQKILTREEEMQKTMASMLKRLEDESKRQEELTIKLESITGKFDKAKPAALKLMARVFFYARRYNELRDSFNNMREVAVEEVRGLIANNPTLPSEVINGMLKKIQSRWEVIQGDHALAAPNSLRAKINGGALREVRNQKP